jgi:hypothetical protein
VGELCEECWRREEELERVRGYLAEAVADEHKIGPYVKVAPGVFDELTPEGWQSDLAWLGGNAAEQFGINLKRELAAQQSFITAEARGRAAGLAAAACEAERRREANAGDPRRRQAWAAFVNLARWCRRRAEE